MIENIFQLKWVVARHKQAPLLKEREQFLEHCHQQGTSHKALHSMAPELIAVIHLLQMVDLREVSLEEIKQAAKDWVKEQHSNPKARSYEKSASYFVYVAKKWLRFHGKLRMPSPPRARFADELDDFVAFMATEQGLSPISIRSHRGKTSKFLDWFADRHRLLSSASLDDVDEFLAFKANNGWNRESVSTAAQALRSFFRHAERRSWCKPGIAAGIQGPKIYQYAGLPEGPSWDDVRRLLQSSKGSSPAAIRARAILLLVAVYGLRSGEVRRLFLDDIDWQAETFVVTHSKRGGIAVISAAQGCRRRHSEIPHESEASHSVPQRVRDAPSAISPAQSLHYVLHREYSFEQAWHPVSEEGATQPATCLRNSLAAAGSLI